MQAPPQAQSIPAIMRTQLKEKQVKLRDLLQLNPTIDNPLDELTYSHWIHRVTNICIDAAQMALMAVDTSDRINNYVYHIQVYYSMSIADGDPAFDYLKFTRYN